MKRAVVPTATKKYFSSGQHCETTLPGDMILVRHHGILPTIIRFGQHSRYFFYRVFFRKEEYLSEYCRYNHAMTVVEGGPNALVSQMEAKGGTIVPLKKYSSADYAVISVTYVASEQRIAAARFGKWCEHIKYAWFSIFGCTIDILIPVVAIALGSGQRMICSTAASLAMRCVGLIPDKCDVSVMPADLARYFDVRPSEALCH